MGKIRTIISKQEPIKRKVHEIAGDVESLFSDKAYLYVIMDDEVALGVYENSVFQIRLASGEILFSIPWEYVKEIVVFCKSQELRLRRFGDEFRGRLRVDGTEDGQETYVMYEVEKLWGETKTKSDGWSMLSSLRGSTIWVPMIIGGSDKVEDAEKMIGIQVCRYMDFPDASEKRGLIHRKDERFLEFCPWPQEGGERDGLFYKSL